MKRPVIVQHVAGMPGLGGPATALERILGSALADSYSFSVMRQDRPAGGLDLRLVARWVKMLRALRPDIVHIRGLGNEGFHGVLAARLAGCPRILLSVHGTSRDLQAPMTMRRRIVIGALEPASLSMATHIATVCRSGSRRSFLNRHRPKLMGSVPNGVDGTPPDRLDRERLRRELCLEPQDVALVVVGRLTIEKGHFILAEALSRLGPAVLRTPLVVVGEGPDSGAIQSAYGSVHGLRISMLGSRRDVARILNAVDIFVFPTLHENLSNALLEGMAAGLPIVATRVGGNVEVLEDGGGVLVDPSDALALAAAIRELSLSPNLRREVGGAGRRIAERKFSVRHMVAGWDSIYQRILEGSR